MKKSLLAFGIASALIASSTTVTYADAINYNKYKYLQKVEKNNFDLDQINEKLEDEYDEYILALRAQKTIKEMSLKDFDDNYDDSASRLEMSKIKLYNHLEQGKEYHDKYIEKKKKQYELTLTGEENYYNYINAEKSLKNAIGSFNLSKSTYESKKLEHNLGKISDIDLLGVEKIYNDSYIAQLQANNNFEIAKHRFNKFISEPINTQVTLQEIDIELPSYKIDSLEDMLNIFLENSYQLSSLELELERLKMDRVLKGRYAGFSNTKIEIENLNISIKEIEHQIKDMKLDLNYQLRTKYNDTIVAENKFKSADLNLSIERSNYNVSKIKHNNQMISDLEYIKNQQTYDHALNAYFDAKLNAYTAIKTFNNFIELNSTPVKMDFK